MLSKIALDRSVYNAVRKHLIRERLEKTPVVKTLADVNHGRVNPVNKKCAIGYVRRWAFYQSYAGYRVMYVRAGIVYLNS